ncbi:CorA family divalent cation transporter [Streptomyces sp. NPDC054961]
MHPLVPVVQGLLSGPGEEDHRVHSAPYVRDVADHLHRTDIEVRTLDELLNPVLDAQQARVGTWQNDDMRRISAWAAVFAIPAMVAGVYGRSPARYGRGRTGPAVRKGRTSAPPGRGPEVAVRARRLPSRATIRAAAASVAKVPGQDRTSFAPGACQGSAAGVAPPRLPR